MICYREVYFYNMTKNNINWHFDLYCATDFVQIILLLHACTGTSLDPSRMEREFQVGVHLPSDEKFPLAIETENGRKIRWQKTTDCDWASTFSSAKTSDDLYWVEPEPGYIYIFSTLILAKTRSNLWSKLQLQEVRVM